MLVFINRCCIAFKDAGMIDQKMLTECSVYNMLGYVYNMLRFLKDAEQGKIKNYNNSKF